MKPAKAQDKRGNKEALKKTAQQRHAGRRRERDLIEPNQFWGQSKFGSWHVAIGRMVWGH